MWAAGSRQSAVERLVAAMFPTLLLATFQGHAAGDTPTAPRPLSAATPNETSRAADDQGHPASGSVEPLRVPRPSNQLWQTGLGAGPAESAPRGPGSGGWWLGSAGITLVLAVCGAACVAARRYWPQEPAASLRVVGRVSLSSRHSIFLVRAGERVLLIGTGNQGAPSLLGELTEAECVLGSTDPALRPSSPEDRTARPFEVTTARALPSLDIHLGEDA